MSNKKNLLFSEYIKQLPPKIVFENLLEKSDNRRILSAGLISDICKSFITPESLKKQFLKLSPDARTVCSFAYLTGLNGISIASDRNELHEELLSSFLVYAVHDKNGVCYYKGFDDLEINIRDTIINNLSDSVISLGKSANVIGEFSYAHILNDLTFVAVTVLQNIVKFTQNSGLVRASNQLINKITHAKRSKVTYVSNLEDLKSIPELLINFGVTSGLICRTEDNYSTTSEVIESWLNKSYVDNLRRFREFTVFESGGWRVEFIKELFRNNKESWISFDGTPVNQSSAMLKSLQLLNYIGLLDIAVNDSKIFWRYSQSFDLSNFNEESLYKNGVTILPDFTAILAQEVSPESLYEFCLIGKLSSLDHVYNGALDRETLNNSLSQGVDSERLIKNLKLWNTPGNVLETVIEWIREFKKLYVTSKNVVISFDKRTTMELKSFGPFQKLVDFIDADSIFLINEGKEKETWDLLSGIGYDPRLPQKQKVPEITVNDLHKHVKAGEFSTVLEFKKKRKENKFPQSRSGKYGSELKELDINEMYHVIDYAILMNLKLHIEYEGSPYIKAGNYDILPIELTRGLESVLEASVAKGKKNKKFNVRMIRKIGVDEG